MTNKVPDFVNAAQLAAMGKLASRARNAKRSDNENGDLMQLLSRAQHTKATPSRVLLYWCKRWMVIEHDGTTHA